ESGALLAGVHADDVDLADVLALIRGDLGPVKAHHGAVPLRDEEARRVKPRFLFAQLEIARPPGALFRVLSESTGVEAQPLLLVAARAEGAQRAAVRESRLVQRVAQRPAHLPQRADTLESGR